MARFAMITEADARMLPEGSTVELLPRGHITPLAADTLRERRITVLRADQVVTGDGADLVPAADVRRGVGRLYIGMAAGLAAWGIAALVPFPAQGVLARSLLAITLAPILSAATYWLRGTVRRSDRAPTPMRTMLLLGLVGGLDWGAVLLSFVLAGRAVGVVEPTVELMAVFFIGHVVGLVSMVPGGLGTADATWLLQLARAGVPTSTAAAFVMLFRLTFYIVPWLLSLVVIGAAIVFHQAGFNGRAARRGRVAPGGSDLDHPR